MSWINCAAGELGPFATDFDSPDFTAEAAGGHRFSYGKTLRLSDRDLVSFQQTFWWALLLEPSKELRILQETSVASKTLQHYD